MTIPKQLVALVFGITLFSCNSERVNNNKDTHDLEREIPQSKTIDEFGEQIFKLIQSDSYNEILELMPNLDEYKSLVTASSLSEEKKEFKIKGLEDALKTDIESLKSTYSTLRNRTEKAGIDWAKTQLEYIDYDHIKKDKIEKADIFLNISFKGVKYKIELKDCVKIGDVWFMGNQTNWQNSSNNYYNNYSEYNNWE